MENSPSRIAADILITAMETKMVNTEDVNEIVAEFNKIHAAVHAAAREDHRASVFKG